MPSISIVIPVYNAARTLPRCLDSILAQTMTDYEVICVNDGSTDESLDILKSYASQDPRFTVITQPNSYGGAARNTGMDKATGEYLLFLDADDFFDERLLELTYGKALETDAQIVMFGARQYDETTGTFNETPWYLKVNMIEDLPVFNRHDIPENILSVTLPVPWTKLYRTDFIREEHLHFQPLQNTDDSFFTLSSVAIADRIAWVDRELVNYRVGNADSSQNSLSKAPCCFIEAYRAIYDELCSRGIYQEIERSFTRAALASAAKHFTAVPDLDAKFAVMEGLASDSFQSMGLLDHPLDYYPNKMDYYTVLGATQAYKFALASTVSSKHLQKVVSTEMSKAGPAPEVSLIIIDCDYDEVSPLSKVLRSHYADALKLEVIFATRGKQRIDTDTEIRGFPLPITIFSLESEPLSSAWQACIQAARGTYLAVTTAQYIPAPASLIQGCSLLKEHESSICLLTPPKPDECKQIPEGYFRLARDADFVSLSSIASERVANMSCALLNKSYLLNIGAGFNSSAKICGTPFYVACAIQSQAYGHLNSSNLAHLPDHNVQPSPDVALGLFAISRRIRSTGESMGKDGRNAAADALMRYSDKIIESARSMHASLSPNEQMIYFGADREIIRQYEIDVAMPAGWIAASRRWKREAARRKTQVEEKQRKLQIAYDEKYERGQIISSLKNELRDVRSERDSINAELQSLRHKLNYINPKAWIRYIRRRFMGTQR